MDRITFKAMLQDTLQTISVISDGKGEEYATDEDELHNFKKAANLQGVDAIKALSGMMAKHTISLYDMMNSGKSYPKEKWDEKIIDHIVYLILLRAIISE